LCSRRSAEHLISSGRVAVDGERATVGQKVDPATAQITVDGLPLPVAPELVHYLVYKPVDVISTAADTHGRRTVVDLVPDSPRVYPIGRLDADSEGLLILTNDGALTELITHPRFGVTKTYVVMVDGTPSPATLRSLAVGVELDDGPARAHSVRVLDTHGGAALLEIVMTEGRKREVRRMLDAVGHKVRRLVRTAIGPLRDAELSAGSWRNLTIHEIRSLYSAAGSTWEDGA
jgi:23S rRNA pseudouridine2605 synthase